jgi:hypothetical protein
VSVPMCAMAEAPETRASKYRQADIAHTGRQIQCAMAEVPEFVQANTSSLYMEDACACTPGQPYTSIHPSIPAKAGSGARRTQGGVWRGLSRVASKCADGVVSVRVHHVSSRPAKKQGARRRAKVGGGAFGYTELPRTVIMICSKVMSLLKHGADDQDVCAVQHLQ